MPSIASHLVVCKLVSESLGINDMDFVVGNILPDIINNKDSHHKIKGKYYDIPDINYFLSTLDLTNLLNLGYLCHLLLDKFFLDEYVLDNIDYKEVDPFISKKIYNDYSIINYYLINEFNLNIDDINDIMNKIDLDLNDKKFKSNLKSINNKMFPLETEYINYSNFVLFLKDVSKRISSIIKEVR